MVGGQVLQYLAEGPWAAGQEGGRRALREHRFISVLKHATSHTPHGSDARLG